MKRITPTATAVETVAARAVAPANTIQNGFILVRAVVLSSAVHSQLGAACAELGTVVPPMATTLAGFATGFCTTARSSVALLGSRACGSNALATSAGVW